MEDSSNSPLFNVLSVKQVFSDNMEMNGDLKNNCTYPRSIYVKYLRILLSSFEEEDFQRLRQSSGIICS